MELRRGNGEEGARPKASIDCCVAFVIERVLWLVNYLDAVTLSPLQEV